MKSKESHLEELRRRIEELKKRFPAHSISPALMAELDELEEQLEEALKTNSEKSSDDN